jgi:DNA-binding transcriptional regulator of glucitol operon
MRRGLDEKDRNEMNGPLITIVVLCHDAGFLGGWKMARYTSVTSEMYLGTWAEVPSWNIR